MISSADIQGTGGQNDGRSVAGTGGGGVGGVAGVAAGGDGGSGAARGDGGGRGGGGGWNIPPSKIVLGVPWYGYIYKCQSPVPDPLPSNPIYSPGLLPRPNCSAGVAPIATFPVPCCSPWAPYAYAAARDMEYILAGNASGMGKVCTSNCTSRVWDAASASVVFECTCESSGNSGPATMDRFQTWFDDANSTAVKASLAHQFNLGGFGMWTAGNAPDGAVGAQYWKAIVDHFVDFNF